jgi:hypothetical protein
MLTIPTLYTYRIHSGLMYLVLSLRKSRSNSQSSSQEVLEIIDLTIDDNEAPIPNMSSHRDKVPLGYTPVNTSSFIAERDIVVHSPKDLMN